MSGRMVRRASGYFTLALCVVALLVSFSLPVGAQDHHGALTPLASSEPIVLVPVVTAPPGTEQAYLITGRVWEIDESAEPLAQFPQDEAVEQAAIYVRYRVLEPGPDGALRLDVYAQSLDPRSGAPLAHPSWSDVMSVTPEGIAFGRGDVPDWTYVLTESPEWAGELVSRAADLPQGPATPGATWRSSQDLESLGLPLEFLAMSAYLGIDGTFTGWAMDGEQKVAVVHERFQGEATGVLSFFGIPHDCDAACMEEMSDWLLQFGIGIEGEAEIWLVPGDFPWGGRSSQYFEVDFGEELPTSFAYGEVDIRRFFGAITQVAAPLLGSGETLYGALGPDSLVRAEDNALTYAPTDLYSFVGQAGHQALVTMTSPDVDPLLILLDADGDYITDAGAYSDGEQYVAELYIELPYAGLYYVQATTPQDGGQGEYAISLETGTEIEYTPSSDDWFSGDWWSDTGDADWDSIDWDSIDWDSLDWLWEDWDFDSESGELDYTECETLQAGTHPIRALAPGTPVSDVLPPETDVYRCDALPHLYSFYADAGTEILLQMVSDDFDAYLVLLDSAWNVLDFNDDSAGDYNPQIRTTLDETGAYFVLAGESQMFAGYEGGLYTLYLDVDEAVYDVLSWCGYPRSRTPTRLDETGDVASYLSSWDAPVGCDPYFELFTFEANAGDTVVIDAISSEFDTMLVLTDANLVTLLEDDDSGERKSARIETTIDATGVYYVKVLGYWPGSFGYYNVKLSVNGLPPFLDDGSPTEYDTEVGGMVLLPQSPWELVPSVMPDCYVLWEENALHLVSGDSIYEDLNANEQTMYNTCATHLYSYSFDAEAGDEVLIEVYADDPRTYAALYDADWELLFETDSDDSFAEIFTTLSAPGRYFIVAGAYSSDYAPGSYQLYLDFGPALFDLCWSPGAPELVDGESVTHERDLAPLPSYCNGLSDLYTFYGEAGETITLDMRSSEFFAYIGVYDDEFGPLGAADSYVESGEPQDSASITLTLPYSGEYYVEANLTQRIDETVGTYTLWFGREDAGDADGVIGSLPSADVRDATAEEVAWFVGAWAPSVAEIPGGGLGGNVDCSNTINISVLDGARIKRTSQGEGGKIQAAIFTIKSFGDHFPWWGVGEGGGDYVARRVLGDAFDLASVDAWGRADWDGAIRYTRCS